MSNDSKSIRVAELFAGVGGFRLALDGYSDERYPQFSMESAGEFKTVWANQWEPGSQRKQYAWRCYEKRFGKDSCENEDINSIVKRISEGNYSLPKIEMLVAGFPCQDYSVAKPLRLARGLQGEKGRLWWTIYEILKATEPQYILLENVDKLLRGKAGGYGRDFATILSSLDELGYSVEWRIINAAEYGFPQKRRRVFIFGDKQADTWNLEDRILNSGVIAEAFPVTLETSNKLSVDMTVKSLNECLEERFIAKNSPFQNSGAMQNKKLLTMRTQPKNARPIRLLKDILVPASEIPEEFYIEKEKLSAWKDCRKKKNDKRTNRDGIPYTYNEGAMVWPDPIDRPARTILTGEGGRGASRTKHAIRDESGRIRRLVPDELDQLQGFPKGWTNTGMTDGQRAFCMGNALVVQIPHEIGKVISKRHIANQSNSA